MALHDLHTDEGWEGLSHGRKPDADMVFIPGGTFRMGSDKHYPEEAPAHRVTVDAFCDGPHAGDEPAVRGIRQSDRPRYLCRNSA